MTSMTLVEQLIQQIIDNMTFLTKEDLPTNVSAFNNDRGYLTSAPVTSVNGNTGAVSLNLFSGNYVDLIGRPTLFSGDYNSLTNKPAIPAAQVNSDWNSTSGLSQILNKPAIPVVRRSETFNGVTNASGNYSVVYTTPYASVPDVQPQLTAGTPSQVVRITSSTVSGFTVNVTNRASVTLLATEILLAATTPVSAAAVSVLVTARN